MKENPLVNNKIRHLITGGSGFLGSHLAKKLLKKGDNVICLDNFFTGTKDNIKDLIDQEDFSVLEMRLR